MRSSSLLPAVVVVASTLALAACGEDAARIGGGSADRLRVVATTTHVADLVRNVGGARVDVAQLLSPGTDPHVYELRPDDARRLAAASVIVRSGGDVDEWLSEAIDAARSEADVVSLIEAVQPLRGGHDHAGEEHEDDEHGDDEVDPHWWQDPRSAVTAAATIADALAHADPARAPELRRGRGALRGSPARSRPCGRRVLGPRPAARPQARHHARRARLLRASVRHRGDRHGHPVAVDGRAAVGGSARGARRDDQGGAGADDLRRELRRSAGRARRRPGVGRTARPPLWADSLGPAGSTGATYVDSVAANTRAMVEELSGGAVRCDLGAR